MNLFSCEKVHFFPILRFLFFLTNTNVIELGT